MTDIKTENEKEANKLAIPGPNCIAKNFAKKLNVIVNAKKEIIRTIADNNSLKKYNNLFLFI
jgi:hypothetical protein